MSFTGNGRFNMHVHYNDKTDLIYIRLDEKKHDVINKRVDEDIVVDIGAHKQIIGIEIMNASKHLKLKQLLPIEYTRDSGFMKV